MEPHGRFASFQILRNASLGTLLFSLLLFSIVGALLFSFFSLLLGALAFQLPIDAMLSSTPESHQALQMLKVVQVFSSLGLFAFPPIVVLWLAGYRPLHFLGLQQAPRMGALAFVVLWMVVQLPWINFTGWFNQQLSLPGVLAPLMDSIRAKELQAQALITQFLEMPRPLNLVLTFFMIAVVPALSEELLFRGALQGLLQRYGRNTHVSVWLSAFIFSFIHFQFLGFLPRLLIGAFLGYLYAGTRNLWYPIAAHLTNNGIAVVLYYGLQQGYWQFSTDQLGAGSGMYTEALISVLLTVAGAILWQRFFKRSLH